MLILVRHGRTAANAAGLLQGRRDNPLDEVGELQAAAVAAAVGPVDLIVSSPLRRARQTAAAFGAEVQVDDRFVELDYGEWEARPVADIAAESWVAWRDDPDFRPPGGETLRELGTRVREGLDELAPEAGDRRIAVVCHVSPIKAAVAWALGVGDEITWRMWVGPASVSEIGVTDARPSLRLFNRTDHLASISDGG